MLAAVPVLNSLGNKQHWYFGPDILVQSEFEVEWTHICGMARLVSATMRPLFNRGGGLNRPYSVIATSNLLSSNGALFAEAGSRRNDTPRPVLQLSGWPMAGGLGVRGRRHRNKFFVRQCSRFIDDDG